MLKDAAKIMVFVQTEAKIASEPKKSCIFADIVHVYIMYNYTMHNVQFW